MPSRLSEFLEKPAASVLASAGSYAVAKAGELYSRLLANAGETPTWIANATGVVGLLTACLALVFMARKVVLQFLWDAKFLKKRELPPLDVDNEKDGSA